MATTTRFTAPATANSWEFGSATTTVASPTTNGAGFYSYLHSILSPLAESDQSTPTFQPRTTLPTHLPLNITPIGTTNSGSTTTSTTTSSDITTSYTRIYQPQQQPPQPHAHAPPQLQPPPMKRSSTFPVNSSSAPNAATLATVTRQLQAVLNNSNRIGVSRASNGGSSSSTGSTYGVYGRLKACTSCRAAHVACDSGHPACGRCISLGNSSGCVYLPARKRGRPKKGKGKKSGAGGKSRKRSSGSNNSKERRTVAKKSRAEVDDNSEEENYENDEEDDEKGNEGDDETDRVDKNSRGFNAGQSMMNPREVVNVLNAASRQRFLQEQLGSGMGMASTTATTTSAYPPRAGSTEFSIDAGASSGSFSSETEDFSPLAIQQQPAAVSPPIPERSRHLVPRGNPPTMSYDNAGRLTSAPAAGSYSANTSGFPFSHAVSVPTSSTSSNVQPQKESSTQRSGPEATLDRLESLVSSLLKEVIDLKQEQRVLREEVSLLRSSPQPMLRTAVTSSDDDEVGGLVVNDHHDHASASPPTPLDLSCDCYFESDATAADQTETALERKTTFPKPAEVIKLSKLDKERVVQYLPKHLADILLGKVTFHDLPRLYPKIKPHDPEDHSFVITDVRKPFMMIERSVSPLPRSNTEEELKFYWEKYLMPPGYDLIITSLNQACCKLLKYTYDEIVGSSAFSLLNCVEDTHEYDPLWFAGSPYPSSNPMSMGSTRLVTRDGEVLELACRSQMFYDEDGDAAWFVICIDEVLNRFYPDMQSTELSACGTDIQPEQPSVDPCTSISANATDAAHVASVDGGNNNEIAEQVTV